jgi:hypothetical protein
MRLGADIVRVLEAANASLSASGQPVALQAEGQGQSLPQGALTGNGSHGRLSNGNGRPEVQAVGGG